MSGFGNSPTPSQQKPFTIPGPYSSSGQFSPGTANILESIRLRKLREEREAHERAEHAQNRDTSRAVSDRQDHAAPHEARDVAYQDWQNPRDPAAANQATAKPRRQRGFLARMVIGLVKIAATLVMLLIVLAVIVAALGG